MTKIESLGDLRDWVKEEGYRRSAEIEIDIRYGYEENIWVYDYDLEIGQHIDIPGEITLYENAKETVEKEIKNLQKKKKILEGDNDD
ncbi:MAG: hypothetical protein ACOCRO_00495 [Halanaerobiales bacterium]